jgi:hypothetical protein
MVKTCCMLTGYHNRWNRNVQTNHPNLWIFIRKMKDEQRRIHLTITAADNGQDPPRRKRKFRVLEKRIRRLKRDYSAGRRDVLSYWNAVSHAVHEFQ